MANSGQIFRRTYAHDYTQIHNDIIKNKGLSLEEKGLLVYILCLPKDWILYRENLYKSLPCDKPGAIDRVFKLLQDKKYIISEKVTNEKGHFIGWSHIVYDTPFTDIGENRHRTEPKVGNTEFGESAPILITNIDTNTNLTNTSSPSQVQEVTAVQKIIDLKVTEHSSTEDKIIKAFHKFFCTHRTKPGIPFTHKTLLNAKLKDWHKDLRLLMKTDKRSIDDLRSMLEFFKTSKDPFWRDTVYSLGGIRKNYDTIWDKMQAESVKANEKKPEVKEGVFQGNIKRVTK